MAQMMEFHPELKSGARQNEESFSQEGILEQMNNSGRPGSGFGVCSTDIRDRDGSLIGTKKFLLTGYKG